MPIKRAFLVDRFNSDFGWIIHENLGRKVLSSFKGKEIHQGQENIFKRVLLSEDDLEFFKIIPIPEEEQNKKDAYKDSEYFFIFKK